MPDTETDLYFVYGSLLPGLHNHVVIKDATLISDGSIRGLLVDLGSFPALIPSELLRNPTTETVRGKVYQVTDPLMVLDLDTLEGYDPRSRHNLYEKIQVDVRCADGRQRKANVYAASHLLMQQLSGQESLVPDGDWPAHLRNKIELYRRYQQQQANSIHEPSAGEG